MGIVGLDIGKLTFVACLILDKKLVKQEFKNHDEGFHKLLEWVKNYDNASLHYCMESTGKYGYALAHYLYSQKEIISIVNPAKIKYFGKSFLLRNKTDKVDAELIAKFCQTRHPRSWKPKSANINRLSALLKRVNQLTLMKTQETNRLEAEENIEIIQYIESSISLFEKQMDQVQKAMKALIEADEELSLKSDWLKSIKGVGDRTIQLILANFSDIENFSHPKQLCAFMGINAEQRQSGSSLNSSSMSKMGNPYFRKMLYMPTLNAIVHNPIIKEFYQRLVSRGKPKKLAVCAAMRKLVFIIFGVLKNQCQFDPTYLSTMKKN